MEYSEIYVLRDPTSLAIRYVGHSRNAAKRFVRHLTDTASTHKVRWIASLKRLGLRPVVEVVDSVSSDAAPSAEIAWIARLRASGCELTNSTDGGEGCAGLEPAPEVRAKLYAAAHTGRDLGYLRTQEVANKISESAVRVLRPHVRPSSQVQTKGETYRTKVPVQVRSKVVYTVDYARAEAMAAGVNVTAVRARATGAIVRLILEPMSNSPEPEDLAMRGGSKNTYRERLFTDHEPSVTMLLSDGTRVPRPKHLPMVPGSQMIIQHSSVRFSKNSSPSGSKRAVSERAPTTTPTTARSGNSVPSGGSQCR